ncbi:uncharacterized protein DMAD_00031 [Drosophila madeirensis]|uniref:Uncharacterized protein n=1 Tax=Drosophila madeirensis TaxID=30013 RepID=A0AAU9FWG7_DROMD
MKPIGFFNAEVEVDQLRTEHRFLMVPNNALECDVIVGYDFKKKFTLMVDCDGISFLSREKQDKLVEE